MSTIRREITIGRNDPCLCGSNLKFKKCCLPKMRPPLTQLAQKEEAKELRYWNNRYKKETGKELK